MYVSVKLALLFHCLSNACAPVYILRL